MISSEYIKEKGLEYGADIIGIGDINRYEGTDPRHDPRMILPSAKCVIGAAFRVPRGIYRGMIEGAQNYSYTTMGVKAISEELSQAFLLKMARVIENEGYEACLQRSTPNIRAKDDFSTNPEVTATSQLPYSESVGEGKPEPDVILNFEQSAVICGIGTYGYRGNILTSQFGPFQRFVFIVTNAPLQSDPVLYESICDKCLECVKACPGNAISTETVKVNTAGMSFELGQYDKWQCSVYYRGAHKSNPYLTDEFLSNHPDREAILNGSKRFSQEEAMAIYSEMDFLPKTQYGYVPCLCKKVCDIACYTHLEETGKISKEFIIPLQPAMKRDEI